VKRVLLTGVSGTGKSTVIAALAARGYQAVDVDEEGWSGVVSVPDDELTGLGPGLDWVWYEERILDLLSAEDGDVLFLGGCSPNQGKFYPQLDHVLLLSAPERVIADRLRTRTNNPFGKRQEELERVLRLRAEVEPRLRRGASHEIDTSAPLDQVVRQVLRAVGERA